MRLIDIYKKGIRAGFESDIREKKDLLYSDDPEKPLYPDSRILFGEYDEEVKSIFAAVDIKTPELLIINELRKKGIKIDAALSHHPLGRGSYCISEVIELQKYNWIKFNIDENTACSLFEKIKKEEFIESKGNYLSEENAAAMLGIPLLSLHTPIDNIIQEFFEKMFENKSTCFLKDSFEKVCRLPECEMASKKGDFPFLIFKEKLIKSSEINELENLDVKTGKVFVDMTGGVDPPDEIFKYIKKSGVDTIIGMHYSLDNIKSIYENNLQAIICGHMSSDSIGLNIFCDSLEDEGINIICGPGLYRYKRNG